MIEAYKGPFSAYGAKPKRAYYEGLYVSMKSERSSFDPHWQDLARYMQPRRVRFTSSDRNKGGRRDQAILDNTATMAARTLQSGLHAGLTSPARPWFKLSTPDPDLAEFGPVKQWLHTVTRRMQDIFSQTNLYNALPIVYGDMGVFGTAAMSVLPDSRDLFRATAYPIGSYVIGMNSRGVVNTFMREYEMSVFQVVEMFGGPEGQPAIPGQPIDWSRISTGTRNLWERGDYEAPVQILWVVAPNRGHRLDSPLAKHMLFTSCHFERGAGPSAGGYQQAGQDMTRILRESGYRTFPIHAPRWDITGEDAYGTSCPGMVAHGDTRQLQEMQRKKGQAIAKMIDPPLKGPTSLMTQKTSLLAGDITYVDDREGSGGLRAIHEIGLNLEHLSMDIRETQGRVDAGFYADLFLMLARGDAQRGMQPPTAREVEERHEEKLLMLGPVLERTNDELLDPLIDRTYSMMEDAGLLPPIPEELDQVQLKVTYESIMAQAQRLVGVVGQDRFLQTMVGLAPVFPGITAKINTNRLVDNYGEMLGVDPRAIRSDEDADAILEQQQQQQQAAQAAAMAKDAAQAGQMASQTPLQGGGSALDAITQGMGIQ